jgi:carbonyl reductase 1
MTSTTFLVTGGNQGIGFEIVKSLASLSSTNRVLLASRDQQRGKEALEKLNNAKNIEIVTLDVTSDDSVNKLVEHLQANNIVLDVLINNAGYATKGSDVNTTMANDTLNVNYYGVKRLTSAILENKLLHEQTGRIVQVSSQAGLLKNEEKIEEFKHVDKLTFERVDQLVKEFIQNATSADDLLKNGWPTSTYRMSKLALNAYSRLFAKKIEPQGITLNCCCPGWCVTRMGGDGATRTAEKGAEVAVWLATAPRSEINGTGNFYFNNKQINF